MLWNIVGADSQVNTFLFSCGHQRRSETLPPPSSVHFEKEITILGESDEWKKNRAIRNIPSMLILQHSSGSAVQPINQTIWTVS